MMNADFGLIETIYAENNQIPLLQYHKARLQKGFDYLDLDFEVESIFESLQQALENYSSPSFGRKIRLLVSPKSNGLSHKIEVSDFDRSSLLPIRLGFSKNFQIDSATSLSLKTTRRSVYDGALAEAKSRNLDDLILCNEKGEVVETGIYTILWQLEKDGQWFTSHLSSGCIAGVQRAALLASGYLQEGSITPIQLHSAYAIQVCNALRGVAKVKELVF